ncbi:cytochrome P450 [Cristinia sonorae]|uniref:Cytochrome P450 n=1 Tax=Cristinia sonorae TaxID=1940300 RepID=A0A8K0US82_9AGAR|nr:cytochrome P450 [Cristinia sonorae]
MIQRSSIQMISGGSDTSVSALKTFMLAMVLHPEARKRAQVELDTVIGKDRLPNFDDQPNLPFLTAIVRETIRWHPPTPLGTFPRFSKFSRI